MDGSAYNSLGTSLVGAFSFLMGMAILAIFSTGAWVVYGAYHLIYWLAS